MKAPVYNPGWPDEVKAVYKHDMEQTWDASLAPHLFNEYRHMIETYLEFIRGREKLKILDVGCAQATLAMMLAEAGHTVVALDMRQGFLDYAASRYEKGDISFVCGNVFEIAPHGPFDLIYVNQVVEHMLFPDNLLKRLSSWLIPGGNLVVSTPNGWYIKNSLPFFSDLYPAEKYQNLQYTADGDGHFFAYTPDELRQLFISTEFDQIEIRCFETPWMSGHMKFRYLHRLLPYQVLRILDKITLIIPWIGKRFSYQILATGCKSL